MESAWPNKLPVIRFLGSGMRSLAFAWRAASRAGVSLVDGVR